MRIKNLRKSKKRIIITIIILSFFITMGFDSRSWFGSPFPENLESNPPILKITMKKEG